MKAAILVSGWGGPGFEWKFSPIFTGLNNAGYDLTIFKPCNRGWGDMAHNGRKLARLVESKQDYDSIHLVGHSMGGILARTADVELTLHSDTEIDSIVTLGSPHHGTLLSNFAFFSTSAKQMAIGSEYLTELNSVPSMHNARYYCIAADNDGLIWPRNNAIWEGAASEDYIRTTHLGLILNKEVSRKIVGFFNESEMVYNNQPEAVRP